MLVIAAHVLGDIERWWNSVGRRLNNGLEIADAYRQLRQAAREAEVFWSLLPSLGEGHRIYTSLETALATTLELREVESMIVVWDLRFHTNDA